MYTQRTDSASCPAIHGAARRTGPCLHSTPGRLRPKSRLQTHTTQTLVPPSTTSGRPCVRTPAHCARQPSTRCESPPFGPLVACSVLEYTMVGLNEEGKPQRMWHLAMKRQRWLWFFLAGAGLVGLLMIQCAPGNPAVTATPTKTRVVLALATNTPLPTLTPQPSLTPTPSPAASATAVAPTPSPALPSPSPPPTDTPLPVPTEPPAALPPTWTPSPPPTVAPTRRPPPTVTVPVQPPLAPQQGGEWDMEAGFVPGSSPLGEICPGWAVAIGWQASVAPGTPASSCLNENKYSLTQLTTPHHRACSARK